MLDDILNWAESHETLLWWLGIGSVATLVLTLVGVSLVIARLPAEYFAGADRRPSMWSDAHPALRLTILIARNTLGLVFLLAGLAMLVLPGQGLLTMFIALVLVDFPGKYRVERWLIAKPAVRKPMDWIRHKAGREPLSIDPSLQGNGPKEG